MCFSVTKFAFILALLHLFASSSFADTVLFEGTYKGKYAGFTIVTTRSLVQLDDGSYRLTSKASNLFGSLSESSHFTKHGDIWRPLEYVYKRRVVGAKAQEIITFDWEDETAHYTHSKKPENNKQHYLAPGMLDPALYQLRIQRDLSLGEEDFDYRFIKRNRIRHYVVEHQPAEGLTIGGNKHAAIQVQRADSDDDKQTYVWVLPDLHYLLGKIVHEEDGDSHQMVLTEYKVNEALLHDFFTRDQAPQQASRADAGK